MFFQCDRTFVSPFSVVCRKKLAAPRLLTCMLTYMPALRVSCQRGGLHELYINVLFSLLESRVRVIKLSEA